MKQSIAASRCLASCFCQAPALWGGELQTLSWCRRSGHPSPCPEKEIRARSSRPAHLCLSTWLHSVFRVTSPLSFIQTLVRRVQDMFPMCSTAARQSHFEVGILVLLQQAVQEEECFPLMFISCEHCWPHLELISCMVPFKNRKYILPTFQMLWNAAFGGKEKAKWEKYGTFSFSERSYS